MKRFFLGLVVAASVAFAQGMGPGMMGPRAPGGQQPSFTQLQSYLGLTADQVTQLTSIVQAERQANQTLVQQIADKRQALDTAMQGQSPTAAELGQLLLDVKNLETQLQQNRSKYHDQAVALLTTQDQKTKLAQLQAAADLQPTIHEAMMVNLLTPPANASGMRGPGFGPGGWFNPMMRRGRR